MPTKAFKFRLRPTPAQRTELQRTLDVCRELYNAGLQEKRDAYKLAGVHRSCSQQQADLTEIKAIRPDVALVYAQVLQDVLKRLHRAFDAFFRRVKEATQAGKLGKKPRKPGYPRFKGRDRYDSFTFPQVARNGLLKAGGVGMTERGRLNVHGIPGDVKVIWHREMVGRPKTAQLKREGRHWYVVLTCDQVPMEERERSGRDCGIDVGLKSFAVLDDGTVIANPRHLRNTERDIRLASRKVNKKPKRSKRRRKARAKLAAVHRHVANQRRDHHHKAARAIVRKYDRIAVEDLNVAGLARGRLSKSVHDAGWSQFLEILSSKAECAGCEVIKVAASGTSQQCSACGDTVPKDLSVRVHRCPCGYVADRDVNAAMNIRARAFASRPGCGLRRGASGRAGSKTGSHATDDPRSPVL